MRASVSSILSCLLITLCVSSMAFSAFALDLEPTDVEVTQAVQDLSNTVTLVEGRETWVRVLVGSDGVGAVATAELFGTPGGPGGTELGPLVPANTGDGNAFIQGSPNRDDPDRSFLFALPRSWIAGDLTLRAVIDSGGDVTETDETNNQIEATVSFSPRLDLRVAFLDIIQGGAGAPSVVDKLFAISQLVRSFPATRVDLRGWRSISISLDLSNDRCNLPEGTCDNFAFLRCSSKQHCGCGAVNNIAGLFRNYDQLSNPGFFEPERKYYGLVDDADGAAFMRGCSPTPGSTGAGPTGDPSVLGAGAWDTDASYADWYTAHELGHAFGRPHAPCCGAVGPASGYPDAECSLSSTGDDRFYGFDSLDRTPLPPSFDRGADGGYTDMMTYCPNQWASDYTSDLIYSKLAAEAGVSVPGEGAEPVEYLLIRGTVDFDLKRAFLGHVYRTTTKQIPIQKPEGTWSLVFRDGQGNVLRSHPFEPVPVLSGMPADPALLGEADTTGLFLEVVPYEPGTAVVQVTNGNDTIDELIVSQASPTVTLLSPNGDETLQDLVTVEWTASDADGDPLLASLFYSPDDGATWTMVAADIDGTKHDLDLERVPGGAIARLRVQVTDGFNVATDDSDEPFSVSDKPPTPVVTTLDGATFHPDENVVLNGLAIDPEDGDVADGLLWYSDVVGYIGKGETIDAHQLPPGEHVITAEVYDSMQQVGTMSISISIESMPIIAVVPVGHVTFVLVLCIVMGLTATLALRLEARS